MSWWAISRPRKRMRHLHPVAILEKADDRLHLGLVVVGVDVGAKLDFLDLDDLLLLARLGRLLLRGVFEAAEIEHLGDRRGRVGGDDHQVEAQLLGLRQRIARIDRALVDALGINQLDFGRRNILVRLRPILLGRNGSHGSANGRCPSAVARSSESGAKIVTRTPKVNGAGQFRERNVKACG